MSLAHNVAVALGKEKEIRNGEGWLTCCNLHQDNKPSLSIWNSEDGGISVNCHSGCHWKDIKDDLVKRGLIPPYDKNAKNTDGSTPKKQEPEKPPEEEKKSYIWYQAGRSDDDLQHIRSYMATRGIFFTESIPPCFKWHSYMDREAREMVHVVVCSASKPDDKVVFAVQRLFVDQETHKKVGAKMHGHCLGRGVWFDRKADVSELIIGEGVETTLSAMKPTGRNGVAALSTAGMKGIILPGETHTIYIVVDSDPVREKEGISMPGQKAAKELARIFEASRSDRRAFLITPDDTCFSSEPNKLDFNDLLKMENGEELIRDRFNVPLRLTDIVEVKEEQQVKTAEKKGIDDYADIFDRYVLLQLNSKVIDTWGHDVNDSMMATQAFTLTHAGKWYHYTDKNGKEKTKPLAEHWLLSDQKKVAATLSYSPESPQMFEGSDGRINYNTFRFPFQRYRSIPEKERAERLKTWNLLAGLIFHEHQSYIEDWLSYTVQYPGLRTGIMPVVISGVGLGKTMTMDIIAAMIGQHNFSNGKILEVTGLTKYGTQWGDWIYNKKISCIEEIDPDGDSSNRYKIHDALKDIITNKTLPLNLKGGKNGTYQIYSNIMGFSNHRYCLKIPMGDRRMFVIDSSSQQKLTPVEYLSILDWMECSDNLASLYQYLVGREISKEFIPGEAKETSHRKSMQVESKNEMQLAFDHLKKFYPCDLVTVPELKLLIAQCMVIVTGSVDTFDLSNERTRQQFHAIYRAETGSACGGKTIRIKRVGQEESIKIPLKAIRHRSRWFSADYGEAVIEYNGAINPLWAHVDDYEIDEVPF